jgi:predicted O-methyltransferase YrrM
MELIKNKHPYNDFEHLNCVRKELMLNETVLSINDFGAGSKTLSTNQRKIKQITKKGIAQKKQAEFLYKLTNKFKPTSIIELGTSIGLTTMYLSLPLKKSTVYTIEGCSEIVAFANHLFEKNALTNIKSYQGHFNELFPKILSEIDVLDLLYVDGNHSYEATKGYFELALTKKNAQSIFVFDDINWSTGMQKAWKEICSHHEVTLSLDFFHFGIVFFRKEQLEKEHFSLKF